MRDSFTPLLLLLALAVSGPAESTPVFTADGQVNPMVLQLPAGSSARLEMPDGSAYEVLVQAPVHHESGNTTWRAALTGVDRPGYVITLTGDAATGLYGTALTPAGQYRIAPAGGTWNAVALTAVSPRPYASLFDMVPSKVAASQRTATDRRAEAHAEPTVLRVLVRYTASAQGNTPIVQWRTELDNLVATASTAFEQSGTRIELVRAGEEAIAIDKTLDNAAAVEALRNSFDVEDQRLIRDAHFVTLLRGWQASHDTCGSANVPQCGDDDDCYVASLGFSAVSMGGSCPTLELAHQIGHNLGSAHEPADSMQGTYAYSHGHVTGGDVGTVMAVGGSSQVAFFSSPDSTDCNGAACGVENLSDNVRSLEQTRHYIDRWVTDRTLGLVDPPGILVRGIPATIAFTRFGIVGTRFDVELWRNGVPLASLADDAAFPNNEMTLTVPLEIEAGTGYTLHLQSPRRPTFSVDLPVTVEEPPPAAELAFTSDTAQAPGNGGSVTVTVVRRGVSEGRVQVDFETLGGSAAGNFTPTSGTLVWEDGDTSEKSITVSNVRSAQSGQVTTIFLVLRNPSEGARVAAPASLTIQVAGQPGGGGGGSFGSGLIAALIALWMSARRRRVST